LKPGEEPWDNSTKVIGIVLKKLLKGQQELLAGKETLVIQNPGTAAGAVKQTRAGENNCIAKIRINKFSNLLGSNPAFLLTNQGNASRVPVA
jgi:hypothetical protein